MYIKTQDIIIRDMERKDAEKLISIVRESAIYRFMPDWSDGFKTPEDYFPHIDRFLTYKDSTDVYTNRRYAVTLPDSNEMIGMVGMGLEVTLNEVELAYFMSEKHQRKGYAQQAVTALAEWCFKVSDIPYLILTIDCANIPSNKLAGKCGFELFEKRTPIGHKQPNMESDSYFYYRMNRE